MVNIAIGLPLQLAPSHVDLDNRNAVEHVIILNLNMVEMIALHQQKKQQNVIPNHVQVSVNFKLYYCPVLTTLRMGEVMEPPAYSAASSSSSSSSSNGSVSRMERKTSHCRE